MGSGSGWVREREKVDDSLRPLTPVLKGNNGSRCAWSRRRGWERGGEGGRRKGPDPAAANAARRPCSLAPQNNGEQHSIAALGVLGTARHPSAQEDENVKESGWLDHGPGCTHHLSGRAGGAARPRRLSLLLLLLAPSLDAGRCAVRGILLRLAALELLLLLLLLRAGALACSVPCSAARKAQPR